MGWKDAAEQVGGQRLDMLSGDVFVTKGQKQTAHVGCHRSGVCNDATARSRHPSVVPDVRPLVSDSILDAGALTVNETAAGVKANICAVIAEGARVFIIHQSLLSHIMSLQDAVIMPHGDRCPTSAGIV